MTLSHPRNLITLVSLIVLLPLWACDRPPSPAPDKFTIVCTVGMITDAARTIAGPRAEVTGLMGEGVDPHQYKASPGDIRRLDSANLVLYSGLHLEGRMAEMLENVARRKPGGAVAIAESIDKSLLRADADAAHHPDPHVWFDVSLWRRAVAAAVEAIANIDPKHRADYEQAAAAYDAKLAELHAWCRAELARIPRESRVLVTAHDAFGYFADAYDLDVLAIQGISTDSEAGVRAINDLVDTIVRRKVRAVFVESSVPPKTIQALVEACKARAHDVTIGGELFSDAMGKDGTPEGTYVGMVKHNVDTIVRALAPHAPPAAPASSSNP